MLLALWITLTRDFAKGGRLPADLANDALFYATDAMRPKMDA